MQPNARQLNRDDTLHHVSETQLAVELQRRVIDFTQCPVINDNSYRKLPFGTNKTFFKQATPRMCWDSLGPPSRALVDLPQQQQQQQARCIIFAVICPSGTLRGNITYRTRHLIGLPALG